MDIFDRSTAEPTKTQFAQIVVKALRQIGEQRAATYDDAEFQVTVGDGGDGTHTIDLANLYAEYCKQPEKTREQFIRETCIRFINPMDAPDDFEDAKPDLLPTVRNRSSPQSPQFERDAKTLSAAIRMPAKNLISEAERAYGEIVNHNGFGDMFAIMGLVRNHLAAYFAVPPEDMQSRLLASPWRLYDRVAMSVQVRSNYLLGAGAQVTVHEPKRQQPCTSCLETTRCCTIK